MAYNVQNDSKTPLKFNYFCDKPLGAPTKYLAARGVQSCTPKQKQ
jgi:hypothetical protein